ncbi:hypothetical protein W97_01232 [Coniosporium apollinis CBS 100218]|uniref:Restriction of telomere capping protein 4 n=1 Tax=Coniosporium apollinis (strain CBS 100218) TaxID=1168221 RepID=R7YJG1_CONA1|nr:uncharacterized protein W97_01232 [Coniosporium apollinis CBS 100218]EON62013.1 hypothetical protein W97_01232 [Coniosporium apollinis CBS 100218]
MPMPVNSYNLKNGIQAGVKGSRHSSGPPISIVGNRLYRKQHTPDTPPAKQTPRTPLDDDDIHCEPKGSSDEELASDDAAAEFETYHPTRSRHAKIHPPRKNPPRVLVQKEQRSDKRTDKRSADAEAAESMVETKGEHEGQDNGSRDEGNDRMNEFQWSQESNDRKRKREVSYRTKSTNIHALQPKTSLKKERSDSPEESDSAKGPSGWIAPPVGARKSEKLTFKRPSGAAKKESHESDSSAHSFKDTASAAKFRKPKKNNTIPKEAPFVQPRGQSTADGNAASSAFRFPSGIPTPDSSLGSHQERDDRGKRRSARTAKRPTKDDRTPVQDFIIPTSLTGDNIKTLLNETSHMLEKPYPKPDTGPDRPSSPLTSVPDSPIISPAKSIADLTKLSDEDNAPAICPMCRDPVDPDLLRSWTVGKPRMALREQIQFCRAHKQHEAEQTCIQRGYPPINWARLPTRMRRHNAFIESILEQRVPSHFRDRLAEKVSKGENRSLMQTLKSGASETLTPGYYGPKGARVMMDHITKTFSAAIRTRAGSDRLIASGGVSGYIQAVLVPELATRLVMDDMGVGEARAREVLAESIEIGELLNEQEQDRVKVEDDDEDGGMYE